MTTADAPPHRETAGNGAGRGAHWTDDVFCNPELVAWGLVYPDRQSAWDACPRIGWLAEIARVELIAGGPAAELISRLYGEFIVEFDFIAEHYAPSRLLGWDDRGKPRSCPICERETLRTWGIIWREYADRLREVMPTVPGSIPPGGAMNIIGHDIVHCHCSTCNRLHRGATARFGWLLLNIAFWVGLSMFVIYHAVIWMRRGGI